MPIIRPVSDLQRKLGEVSKLAIETGEPVYLTKNGAEHLVLIDAEAFTVLEKMAHEASEEKKEG